MLDAIQAIGERSNEGSKLHALAGKVSLIETEAKRTLVAEYNLAIVQQRLSEVKKFLTERATTL